MLKTLKFSARLFLREVKSGEWLLIFFALVIAISAITTLHFYTDRVERGLYQQSAKILGGDLVITSSTPIPSTWMEHASQLHLNVAEVWTYPTMIRNKEQLQLVSVQAVSKNYPLIHDNSGRPDVDTLWIEPRVFTLLNVKINDEVNIGNALLQVKNTLQSTFDTLNTGWLIAPKVMMRLEDIPKTKTVILGSRVDYRMLFSGSPSDLKTFESWIIPRLMIGQRLIDVRNQQARLTNIFSNTENYTNIALLVCILLAGTAIVLSTRLYLNKHYSQIALWRCLGAKRKQITMILSLQLVTTAILAGIIGIVIGYYAQSILVNLFNTYLNFPLPAPTYVSVFLGLITSLFLLAVFAYPVISELPLTSPLYIWRNEAIPTSKHQTLYFVLSFIVFFSFIYWFMSFSLLALFFMNAITVCAGFMYIFSLLVLTGIRKMLPKIPSSFRQGLSQLVHYPQSVSLQMTVFTLIIMSLLILQNIQSNIISNWQQTLPRATPNYFAINIAPEDVVNIKTFMQTHQVNMQNIYPMVRGRLVGLNQKPISDSLPTSAIHRNALHRELNLSWMWEYPSDNKIVAGQTWTLADEGKAFISVEKELANDLQLHIGDQLTFKIAEQDVTATISNLRTVDWKSFHPNFFIIFTPGFMKNFPTTYIASFHLGTDQTTVLNQLATLYPNVTIIDVANVLLQIQQLTSQVSAAIKYLFLFSLGIGFIILISSVQASMAERHHTYRLLRVLGASKRFIYKSIAVEFLSLAFLIGIISFLLAKIIIYLLLARFF